MPMQLCDITIPIILLHVNMYWKLMECIAECNNNATITSTFVTWTHKNIHFLLRRTTEQLDLNLRSLSHSFRTQRRTMTLLRMSLCDPSFYGVHSRHWSVYKVFLPFLFSFFSSSTSPAPSKVKMIPVWELMPTALTTIFPEPSITWVPGKIPHCWTHFSSWFILPLVINIIQKNSLKCANLFSYHFLCFYQKYTHYLYTQYVKLFHNKLTECTSKTMTFQIRTVRFIKRLWTLQE